jgi:hypothetical protein
MSRIRENNDLLLNGYYLTKPELKDRLRKMGIQLENKDFSKQHYVDLYNRIILEYDRRMKIKSIIEIDMIDNPDKILNRKRERENYSKIQDHLTEEKSNKRRNGIRYDENMNIEDKKDFRNSNDNLKLGNVSFEEMKHIIARQLKSNSEEKNETNTYNSNYHLSPSIRSVSLKNEEIGKLTFARPTNDELRDNNELANFTENNESADVVKRLDYSDGNEIYNEMSGNKFFKK